MRDLRWKCHTNGMGCFRELCPKLGVFDDCFPDRIGMSDVDGVVELGGRFLFLEWKSRGGTLSEGQCKTYRRLTSLSPDPCKAVVLVVSGHPRDMTVETVQLFQSGQENDPQPMNFAELKARVSAWAQRAAPRRFPSINQEVQHDATQTPIHRGRG